MLLLSLFVFGYSNYYQNDVGGSSLGMGGTPIGLSNSIECGLYNPAAFASVGKLNVFTGYKLTRGEKRDSIMIEDLLFEDTLKLDYAFPDYLGIALPFGNDFFFSISLSVPYRSAIKDSMMFAIVDPSEPSGFREFSGEDIRSERFYSLNTTVGHLFKDRLSVGVNLNVFWKHSNRSLVSGDTAFNDVTNTIDKFGIEPCLGLQYKASDFLSLGFLVKKGFGEAYKENVDGAVSSIESDEGLPLVLGLGAGINLKDKIYINLSGEYIRWTLAYDEDYLNSDDYRNVVRLHLGAQYKFNDLLSMSAGFYTYPYPMKLSSLYEPDSYDQMFLTGGIGLDFGRIVLNISAASSALIKSEPSLREENHFNFSLSYR
jgi:opacity protein-like surface antigen